MPTRAPSLPLGNTTSRLLYRTAPRLGPFHSIFPIRFLLRKDLKRQHRCTTTLLFHRIVPLHFQSCSTMPNCFVPNYILCGQPPNTILLPLHRIAPHLGLLRSTHLVRFEHRCVLAQRLYETILPHPHRNDLCQNRICSILPVHIALRHVLGWQLRCTTLQPRLEALTRRCLYCSILPVCIVLRHCHVRPPFYTVQQSAEGIFLI